MAAFPLVSTATFRVTVKSNFTGDTGVRSVVNLFDFSQRVSSPPATANNTNLADFYTILATHLASPYGNVLPDGVVNEYVSIQWMEDPTTAPHLVTAATAWDGNRGATDTTPTSTSWYLKKLTGFRGKSARGSIHMSPILESDTDDFQLTTAFLGTPVQSFMVPLFLAQDYSFTTGGNAFTFNHWLTSTKLSTISPMGPNVIRGAFVTEVAPRKTLGTMKRRKVPSVY